MRLFLRRKMRAGLIARARARERARTLIERKRIFPVASAIGRQTRARKGNLRTIPAKHALAIPFVTKNAHRAGETMRLVIVLADYEKP